MSTGRLRFIHSSDWHLERPPGGLVDLPERFKAALVDAPLLAAEKVVSAALAEEAHFVVLAGDIIDVELAGPRGVAFLLKQFERLAARRVPVYWAGGRVDRPDRWPTALRLPKNVFRFTSGRPEDVVYETDGCPQARITGISRPHGGHVNGADFRPDAEGLPSIAVAHGKAERGSPAEREMSYWALGGNHRRTTLPAPQRAAQYSGTPQARRPNEAGVCGCTLVEIDENGVAHTRQIATDVVRWQTHRVAIGNTATVDSLEGKLVEQAHELRRATPDRHLIVTWMLHGGGPLIATLRHEKKTHDILARLRRHFEHDQPTVWIHALQLETESAVPPGLLEQDSLLGDYLRTLTDLEGEAAATDLVGPLEALYARQHVVHQAAGAAEPDEDEPSATRNAARRKRSLSPRYSEQERHRVLQKAAVLGADLLSVEEVKP